jgi:hypothetical protein
MIFSVNYVYSQTNKGTFLLGGSANISLSADGDYDLSLFPDFGYFLNNNFCIGASMPLIFNNYGSSNSYYIGISPLMRYYFGKNDRSRFYGLGRVNFKLNKSVIISGHGLVDIGIGYVWFINNSVGLETEIISNISSENIVFGAYLGFQVYLNTK